MGGNLFGLLKVKKKAFHLGVLLDLHVFLGLLKILAEVLLGETGVELRVFLGLLRDLEVLLAEKLEISHLSNHSNDSF